ncbi:MAG: hypothetical protein LBJ58_02700 [Tannerellaceae bacterium]|nr:hypothetical protein [Tannerellaceae bacterium]
MKHIVVYIATGVLMCLAPLSAQNAADILSKAADICRQQGGLTASFALNTRQAQSSESFEGVIHIKGDKFALFVPGIKTWYDGRTQWTYIESAEEVNLTTPEGEELQFTNPAILLGSYGKNFAATYLGEVTATNGKVAYDIELAPRAKSDITKVNLQIEKNTSLPVRIAVEMKNKTTNVIQISDIKTNPNHPDSFFTFPEAAYPNAEIIDLR